MSSLAPPRLARAALVAALASILASGSPLLAQDAPAASTLQRVGNGWNEPLALDLVSRARATRSDVLGESSLRSYQSTADGYVYFYVDRPAVEERTLVRTDQLALEVLWKAPGMTRQRIVGRRNEKALPTNINYHLDHLSVVQDEFEDVIRLGDGDEVADVPHPVAPDAEQVYDYRVTDSLTLAYGGLEQVRVYELQVRPRRPDQPGFVGTLYLDRERASIVRMAFSFTPSSYVDPYLDYIRISLDNALWLGEFWLPYRQEAEVRRELPALDFLAGSVIRSRFRVSEYDFNIPLPDFLFRGPLVVNAGPADRLAEYDFERGLYDDVEEMGLAPSDELAEVQDQIREIGLQQALSGLAPVRLHLSGASDLVRYNRVEEFAVGVGTTVRLPALGTDEPLLRLVGGWALGPDRPWARASTSLALSPTQRLEVGGSFDELVDIGPIPGSSRLVNSLAGIASEDYLDPWVERSASLSWSRSLGGLELALDPPTLTLGAGVARQRSAILSSDASEFRAVRAIDEGTWGWTEATLETGSAAQGVSTRSSLRVGFGEGRTWVQPTLSAAWRSVRIPGQWLYTLDFGAGWAAGDAPTQALFLLGGRETLPGFGFRTAGGDAFALLRARASRPLWEPWVTGHLVAAAGWVDDLGDSDVPADWRADDDLGDLRTSVGAGVGLLWDTLRFDLSRGIPGGDWELVFSVRPDFRSWL